MLLPFSSISFPYRKASQKVADTLTCRTRPCNHKFCSVCITAVAQKNRCPSCKGTVKHVAGFSAPMNLPGEETYKVNVPVVMLEVKDGVTISSAMEEMRL